jgi:hypothetical protein
VKNKMEGDMSEFHYQCVTTAGGLKQLGVSIVAVLFSSNSARSMRIEHRLVVEMYISTDVQVRKENKNMDTFSSVLFK